MKSGVDTMPLSLKNLLLNSLSHISGLTASQQQLLDNSSVGARQGQIEKTFESVFTLCQERTKRLEETHRAFVLVREASELTNWIKTKEQHAQTADVGEDLEQVELMQKKFDDFQCDLKANEQR